MYRKFGSLNSLCFPIYSLLPNKELHDPNQPEGHTPPISSLFFFPFPTCHPSLLSLFSIFPFLPSPLTFLCCHPHPSPLNFLLSSPVLFSFPNLPLPTFTFPVLPLYSPTYLPLHPSLPFLGSFACCCSYPPYPISIHSLKSISLSQPISIFLSHPPPTAAGP